MLYFNVGKIIEEIEKEINLGNFEYVIEKCNEYLNLKSDLAFLYNYRGLCKNNLGLYEEAIKDFDISIELNKKSKNSPTTINKDLADAYYYKGLAKNNLREYKEAIDNFNEALKYNYTYWLVIHYNIGISKINLGEIDKEILKNIKKNLLYQYLLLQSLSFNNKILKREFTYNIEIAHYTSLNTLLKLIKEDNKIRITNISNANDPKEGKILENIFNKNSLNIKIKNDENLITLQTSLSRNKDALTMFRLYGKNENKEATGICLVIDKKYFNDNYLSPVIEVNLDNQKQEEKKGNENYKKAKEIIQKRFERKNLYWVIYYNEEKNQLVFNPTKSKYSSVIIDLNTINKNKKNINKIEDLINCIFRNIINSAKEIDKIENKNLTDEIFSNLFENIRYIIKHEAFFEEQELRMLITTNYKNENINIEEDKKRLYINYNELFNENENFIKEIILGGKIEDKELTSDYIKQIIYNKYKENNKMNKIKVSISQAPLR